MRVSTTADSASWTDEPANSPGCEEDEEGEEEIELFLRGEVVVAVVEPVAVAVAVVATGVDVMGSQK